MRQPMSQCPVCSGHLETVKLRCTSCTLTLEGQLPTSRLALLSADQQHFVEAFLAARGNIKEVEKELGISYPTVRKKLDDVAQALGHPPAEQRLEQRQILAGLDRGELTGQQAIALMRALDRTA